MKKTLFTLFLSGFILPSIVLAIDLKESKFTQVVNQVEVITATDKSSDKSTRPATVNDTFKMPDVLRTGPASRAELVAADSTITRVGANTIFSFDPANRTIDLQQGSLLFHSPHGKGGGIIQTATAVASVLGTTIIVSCTSDGGFKLLDLEGETEIRFLNGLKQQLEPGQMTFILPGGNQRAPIIVFRLDTQTQGSTLVNGFDQPLPSLPLINAQIINQLKLIQNLQATDTGLQVGGSATGNSVEAISGAGTPDTIVQSINNAAAATATPTSPQMALQTDASITSSTLDSSQVYFQNTDITADPNNSLSSYPGNPYDGFFGLNIAVNTPTIDLSSYTAQLPYNFFDIVAWNNLDFQGSAIFTGLSPTDALYLSAGNQLSIATGSTLEADFGLFDLAAFQPIILNNVTLLDTVGNIEIDSTSGITLNGGSTVTGLSSATVHAAGAVNISGSAVVASDPAAGTVDITSDTGSITVGSGTTAIPNASYISGNSVTLTAGDGILLDGTGTGPGVLTGVGTAATLTMTAVNTDTVQNADLSSFPNVNMTAHTINLQNVSFGALSTVNLTSFFGLLAPSPNSGATSLPGYVNFISGVTYGGQPAQNFVNPATTTGIFIH